MVGVTSRLRSKPLNERYRLFSTFILNRDDKAPIGAVACFCLPLLSAGAQGQVVYDLPKLISGSDVVAVARVAAVSQTGSGPASLPGDQSIPTHFRVATLHLTDVLKGTSASADIAVRYAILYSQAGWSGGVPPGYTIRDTLTLNSVRLIFLKSVGDHYEFTNGSYLSIVCGPEGPSGAESPDALDRVLSRIKEALLSTSVSPEEKAEAIRQLGAVKTDSVIPALRTFLQGEGGATMKFCGRKLSSRFSDTMTSRCLKRRRQNCSAEAFPIGNPTCFLRSRVRLGHRVPFRF